MLMHRLSVVSGSIIAHEVRCLMNILRNETAVLEQERRIMKREICIVLNFVNKGQES
jgi:hypothetical protein